MSFLDTLKQQENINTLKEQVIEQAFKPSDGPSASMDLSTGIYKARIVNAYLTKPVAADSLAQALELIVEITSEDAFATNPENEKKVHLIKLARDYVTKKDGSYSTQYGVLTGMRHLVNLLDLACNITPQQMTLVDAEVNGVKYEEIVNLRDKQLYLTLGKELSPFVDKAGLVKEFTRGRLLNAFHLTTKQTLDERATNKEPGTFAYSTKRYSKDVVLIDNYSFQQAGLKDPKVKEVSLKNTDISSLLVYNGVNHSVGFNEFNSNKESNNAFGANSTNSFDKNTPAVSEELPF